MDIKQKFLDLTSKTYPHPAEEGVLKHLPDDLKKDKYGNYYKIIGESETVFSSHLDTADMHQKDVTHIIDTDENGDEWISTDGKSILGADDKSGVVVMLYMMERRIPGIYYFFIGEEVGMIGSSQVAQSFDEFEHLQNVKRIISFDRRGYDSIITKQLSRQCCSSEFADYLISEYRKAGLSMKQDPTGIYTDSAAFIDMIPECTNISVGYFGAHTGREEQNMTFLEQLCLASTKVDWESAPTNRRVTLSDESKEKYKDFMEYLRSVDLVNEVKFYETDKSVVLQLSIEDPSAYFFATELEFVEAGLEKYKLNKNYYTEIEGDKIKIHLV